MATKNSKSSIMVSAKPINHGKKLLRRHSSLIGLWELFKWHWAKLVTATHTHTPKSSCLDSAEKGYLSVDSGSSDNRFMTDLYGGRYLVCEDRTFLPSRSKAYRTSVLQSALNWEIKAKQNSGLVHCPVLNWLRHKAMGRLQELHFAFHISLGRIHADWMNQSL